MKDFNLKSYLKFNLLTEGVNPDIELVATKGLEAGFVRPETVMVSNDIDLGKILMVKDNGDEIDGGFRYKIPLTIKNGMLLGVRLNDIHVYNSKLDEWQDFDSFAAQVSREHPNYKRGINKKLSRILNGFLEVGAMIRQKGGIPFDSKGMPTKTADGGKFMSGDMADFSLNEEQIIEDLLTEEVNPDIEKMTTDALEWSFVEPETVRVSNDSGLGKVLIIKDSEDDMGEGFSYRVPLIIKNGMFLGVDVPKLQAYNDKSKRWQDFDIFTELFRDRPDFYKTVYNKFLGILNGVREINNRLKKMDPIPLVSVKDVDGGKFMSGDMLDFSLNEEQITEDLLNEIDFGALKNKISSYLNKGVLTASMVAALMASPDLSAAQKAEIDDLVKDTPELVQDKGPGDGVSDEGVTIDPDTEYYFDVVYNRDYEIIGFKKKEGVTLNRASLMPRLKKAEDLYLGKKLAPNSDGEYPHKAYTDAEKQRMYKSGGVGLIDLAKKKRALHMGPGNMMKYYRR